MALPGVRLQTERLPMTRNRQHAGFTLIELLVAVSLLAILLSIGAVNLAEMRGQMKSGEDVRRLALALNNLRAEAIRLRSNVRISFNSGGYSWDIYDDGTSDGSQNFREGTTWSGGTPTSFVFNGLGLARGIAATTQINVTNSGIVTSLTINSNGFVSL